MNHEENDNLNDKWLDDAIGRAVGKETAQFNAAAWLAKHRNDVPILTARRSTGETPAPRVEGVPPSRLAGILPARSGEDGLTSHSDQPNGTHNAGGTPASRVEGVPPSCLAGILPARSGEDDLTSSTDLTNGTHNAGGTPASRVEGVPPSCLAGILPARSGEDGLTSHSDQPNGTHNAGGTPATRHGRNARATTWRTIMTARATKVAATIAALAAVAILAVVWTATDGGSTIALAQTLEQLKTNCYEFTLETLDNDSGHAATYKCAIMDPGKFRMEETDGQRTRILIADFRAKRSVTLFEPDKAAFSDDDERDFDDENNPVGFLSRSVGDLWGLQTGQETKLESKQIDGQEAQGFRVRVTNKSDNLTETTITVWADAKTAAPLRVDIVHSWVASPIHGSRGITMNLTLRNFKVIPNPDPARFSTEVPEEYSPTDHLGPQPASSVPPAQEVVNFLCQPLPVPEGATVLLVSRDRDMERERPPVGLGNSIPVKNSAFYRPGVLVWRKRVALDVSNMTPEEVAGIIKVYEEHFRQFPLRAKISGSFYRSQNLCKESADRFDLESVRDEAHWSWNQQTWWRGEHIDLDLSVEVMDFVPRWVGATLYERQPVKRLYDTMRGQRVAWISMDLIGRDLKGPCKWPEPDKKPADAQPAAQSAEPAKATGFAARDAVPAVAAAHVLRLDDKVWFAAFSPDGLRMATLAGGVACLWDTADGKELHALQRPKSVHGRVTFSSDSLRVIAGSGDTVARIWDAADGKVLVEMKGPGQYVWSAAFSPDDRRVVTVPVRSGGTVHVWDAATGEELAVLRGHEKDKDIWSAVFSPDGKLIATASNDKTARIWSAETGEQLAVLQHTGSVETVAFSPDSKRVVTGRCELGAFVWDVATGKQLARLPHNRDVWSAVFSPDGTRVLTASGDWTARLWEADTGKELAVLRGHTGGLRMAAFSPDGRWIVSAADDNTARVWSADTGEPVAVLRGHADEVITAAFSPDGRRVITASLDKTARVWEVGSVVENR